MNLTHLYYEGKESQPWIKICNNSNGENILLFPTPREAMEDFLDKNYVNNYALGGKVIYKELPRVIENHGSYYVSCQLFAKK